ncbi:MAG: GldG family protein [bacterium]
MSKKSKQGGFMKGITIPKKIMTITGLVGFILLLIVFGIYATTSLFTWYMKILLGLSIAGILTFWILSAMASRMTRYSSNVAIAILLALIIMVLLNFVSARNFRRIDTTENKTFSLSEQTIKVLKNLSKDINITAFYTENHYRRRVAHDILNEYAQKTNKIRVTYIDPASKPGIASTYQIKSDGTVVFELGDRKENVVSYQNEEQDFTSAILKLTSDKQKKIYFLDGHGEKDIDGYDQEDYSNLKKKIEADNYQVERLILARQTSVPEDCSVLVIAGPKNPLLAQEENAIIEYLNKGGKAIIMVDPYPSPSLSNILNKWGIDIHEDIVLDGFGQTMFGDPSVPVTVKYEYHIITNPISRMMTFFPMARSISAKKDKDKNLEVVELVKTSNDSWGETDLESLLSRRKVERNEGQDHIGPVSIAVAVTKKVKDKEKRVLVVFGDSDFVSNNYLEQGNPNLFMNSLNWLTEDEELISIRPKDTEQMAMVQKLTGKELRFVTLFSIFAVPIILLIIGGRVWWKRR